MYLGLPSASLTTSLTSFPDTQKYWHLLVKTATGGKPNVMNKIVSISTLSAEKRYILYAVTLEVYVPRPPCHLVLHGINPR